MGPLGASLEKVKQNIREFPLYLPPGPGILKTDDRHGLKWPSPGLIFLVPKVFIRAMRGLHRLQRPFSGAK